MLSSHLPILFNPHLPEYAFGRIVLQALLSMSPGFGTLGWGCHLADIPGQLDNPCCTSFGLAICHTALQKQKSDHSFFIHSNRSEMYFGVMFTPLVCHSNILE